MIFSDGSWKTISKHKIYLEFILVTIFHIYNDWILASIWVLRRKKSSMKQEYDIFFFMAMNTAVALFDYSKITMLLAIILPHIGPT